MKGEESTILYANIGIQDYKKLKNIKVKKDKKNVKKDKKEKFDKFLEKNCQKSKKMLQ